MNNRGWVKFWREQFNHWLSEKKPWCDGYAWAYLYSQANYKKGIVNFRNEYLPIERGQYITSKLKMSKKFGWTYRHVENFLKALESDQMIAYRTTNRYIVVTVINYSEYQGNDAESDEQNDEQIRNRLGTDDEQVKNEATQSKKDKKDKKGKKDNNIIYAHWIKQNIIQHKKNIFESQIRTALQTYSVDEIITAITNYAIILHGEEYYWSYKWTLGEFLKRGIEKFIDLNVAKNNYLQNKTDKQKEEQSQYVELR